MKILNKKGMEISLNYIIIAVLALIALIIIALIFTGGIKTIFTQQGEVSSIAAEKVALYKAKCELACATEDKTTWDALAKEFPEEFQDVYPTCDDLTEKSFADGKCA